MNKRWTVGLSPIDVFASYCALLILVIAGVFFARPYVSLSISEYITVCLTAALVIFALLTWRTYEKLSDLQERQNWFTGALESHSTSEHILRVQDRGIPVIWWDPNKEKWDPNKQPWHPGRKHRGIAQIPVIIMYIPESERVPGDKKSAPDAIPFSKQELQALTQERNRLQRLNTKRRGGGK